MAVYEAKLTIFYDWKIVTVALWFYVSNGNSRRLFKNSINYIDTSKLVNSISSQVCPARQSIRDTGLVCDHLV